MQFSADRPLRVLVADDHATNRAVIELILGMISATPISVENGEEAVQAFKTGQFDVVLMDLQMPVKDGLTAIREIRTHESQTACPRTPVLAVTANALSEHVAASKAAGADRHVAKPVTVEGLLSAISAELQSSQMRAAQGSDGGGAGAAHSGAK